jgi:hypothetical protein
MSQTKLFLVQFLIEADVTEWPEFDEERAIEHFRPNLSKEDKIIRSHVYLLARKPDEDSDKTIEKYHDRGFDVEICQDAHTVGTDVPTYFALVFNPQAKTVYGSVIGGGSESIKAAKEAARINVDKRIERQNKKPK